VIVIINGQCGIGKASVAWELNARFDRAVMLDGDYIGAAHLTHSDSKSAFVQKVLARWQLRGLRSE
jgi:hypothetical protein